MIDEYFQDLVAAGRGGFLILRGDSGTGKSTFLHTLYLFREGVRAESVAASNDIKKELENKGSSGSDLRIIVLEEREALKDTSVEQIEKDLHAINGFLRSQRGVRTLIVWPCNTADMEKRLTAVAESIGSDALLGSAGSAVHFHGPAKEQFRKIAENTVATLNQGATLADFGISDDEVAELIQGSDTVGKLLGKLRSVITKKKGSVTQLIKKESCRLWIVVAASTEPDRDVAALTRGRYSAVDIERLMSATEANVVQELKAHPEKLGILATVLDAKIFHLPMLAALDIARMHADADLRDRMKRVSLSDKVTSATQPAERLAKTDLGRAFKAGSQGTLAKGKKAGSNTEEAFLKLAQVAQNGDIALNRAVGVALQKAGYIKSFRTEVDFGSGLKRKTDLYCEADGGIVRVEIMWRAKTGRAEIANYALTKLYNYGRAIGFLE